KQGYLWRFTVEGLQVIRDASSATWPAWADLAETAPRAWLFQASTDHYDVDAALRELTEVRWPVQQHTRDVQAGDRAFLWAPGPDAGLVAVGTVLAAPGNLPLSEDEVRFYGDGAVPRATAP